MFVPCKVSIFSLVPSDAPFLSELSTSNLGVTWGMIIGSLSDDLDQRDEQIGQKSPSFGALSNGKGDSNEIVFGAIFA
jgi:hypothetical protein